MPNVLSSVKRHHHHHHIFVYLYIFVGTGPDNFTVLSKSRYFSGFPSSFPLSFLPLVFSPFLLIPTHSFPYPSGRSPFLNSLPMPLLFYPSLFSLFSPIFCLPFSPSFPHSFLPRSFRFFFPIFFRFPSPFSPSTPHSSFSPLSPSFLSPLFLLPSLNPRNLKIWKWGWLSSRLCNAFVALLMVSHNTAPLKMVQFAQVSEKRWHNGR